MTNNLCPKMPVLFVGHGNPMNCINDNEYTRSWAKLGKSLPSPRAILAISAHWYISGTSVTVMNPPSTIHDFHGFPEELFQIEYPAPGSPKLAEQVADLISPDSVKLNSQWGLDHGTWSVLRHLYAQAQIPVVQLSLDLHKSPEEHYRLGQKLADLRNEGVLIVGSGNIVHNIGAYNWRDPAIKPPAWAIDFEDWNRSQLTTGKASTLINYLENGQMATLSAPSPDHYLPLLYLAGLQKSGDKVSFPVEGFDGGTMSMLSVLLTDE
jgi:4,5-DOPA dioxygenase extradiol